MTNLTEQAYIIITYSENMLITFFSFFPVSNNITLLCNLTGKDDRTSCFFVNFKEQYVSMTSSVTYNGKGKRVGCFRSKRKMSQNLNRKRTNNEQRRLHLSG